MLNGNAIDMTGQRAKSRSVALPKFLQLVLLQHCMISNVG